MILTKLFHRAWRAIVTPPQPLVPGPGALPAYLRARSWGDGAGLEPRLRLSVRQLAAELSGCRWCIEYGRHLWRQRFLSQAELAALRHYRTSPLFSPRERAALAFTEAVSRYAVDTGGLPDPVLAELRRYCSEAEVAALTRLAAQEHFYDPATGALGADAYGEGVTRRQMVGGCAMRNLY